MSIFSKLFGTKPQPVSLQSEQAVLVYLDGQSLPTEVYEQNDLATLEDQLIEVIDSSVLGEFDGNEIGSGEVVLYMYGPSAEALFEGIEPVLRAYPLCKNARVIVRQGGPGAPEREIRLP
jgi:hypothetical protein